MSKQIDEEKHQNSGHEGEAEEEVRLPSLAGYLRKKEALVNIDRPLKRRSNIINSMNPSVVHTIYPGYHPYTNMVLPPPPSQTTQRMNGIPPNLRNPMQFIPPRIPNTNFLLPTPPLDPSQPPKPQPPTIPRMSVPQPPNTSIPMFGGNLGLRGLSGQHLFIPPASMNPSVHKPFLPNIGDLGGPPKKKRKLGGGSNIRPRKKAYGRPPIQVKSTSVGRGKNARAPSTLNGQIVSQDGVFRIIEGLTSFQETKLPGGRTNKEPLALHTLEVRLDNFHNSQKPKGRENYTFQELQQFSVKSLLFGYKKPSGKTIENQLTVLRERKLSDLQLTPNRSIVVRLQFSNLVVHHSSHNHGKKLFLRFVLCDNHDEVISQVDTFEFETITRRGMEKQRVKLDKLLYMENHTPQPQLKELEPEMGLNDQIIVLECRNLPQKSMFRKEVIVMFGDYKADVIYSYNPPEWIIVRSPLSLSPGNWLVKISVNGGLSFFGNKYFKVLDMRDPNQVTLCIGHIRRKNKLLM